MNIEDYGVWIKVLLFQNRDTYLAARWIYFQPEKFTAEKVLAAIESLKDFNYSRGGWVLFKNGIIHWDKSISNKAMHTWREVDIYLSKENNNELH